MHRYFVEKYEKKKAILLDSVFLVYEVHVAMATMSIGTRRLSEHRAEKSQCLMVQSTQQ